MIKDETIQKVYEQVVEPNEPVLKTGFYDLDEILKGIEKSSLITIGARPAMGKTAFMTNLMLNLLEQKKKCLYFSLEMSEIRVVKRLIGQIGEIDSMLMSSPGQIATRKKEIEKFTEALNKITKYDLTIFDGAMNIKDIKEKIEEEKPDCVFIDYLQLIQYSGKKARTEAIDDIMTELKNTAKENNCTIFLTSQLSRALENRYDKRPMLSDLRDSGSIENISDVVLFIYRDDYYNSVSDENDEDYLQNKGEADIIVAKNKYGPTDYVKLLFRSSIMKFLEPVRHELF